jgi:uncharacterized protein YqiB (DUF1249 family)
MLLVANAWSEPEINIDIYSDAVVNQTVSSRSGERLKPPHNFAGVFLFSNRHVLTST